MVTKDLFALHWELWCQRWKKTAMDSVQAKRLFYEVVSEAMGDEQFERASKVVFRDNEFFPTPKQLIEAGGPRGFEELTEAEKRQWIIDHHRPARLGEGKWAEWRALDSGERARIGPPQENPDHTGHPPPDVLERLEMLTHPGRTADDVRKRLLTMEAYEADGMKNPPKIELPKDFVVGGKPKPKEEAC